MEKEKKNRRVVPAELLSKEFLSQFRTEDDMSSFLTDLHAQVLEGMLQGKMDAHLGYEKHSPDGNNTGNSRNGSFPKKIQTQHEESVIQIPRDHNSDFEPIAVPKHQSRGVEDILITVTDNLNGFTDTIRAVFPESTTQICVVHQIRNSCRYVVWKDMKAFTADMKEIYTAVNREQAASALAHFEQVWGSK